MTTPHDDALTTERLGLEPLSVAHAAEMVGVLSSPSLYRFTGGTPPTLEELKTRYVRQTAGSGRSDETWLNWVIRLGGDAVGFVQATVVRHDTVRAELAWLVRPDSAGRGIATEAAGRVVTHLREAHGVDVFTAHIAPGHTSSEAVARHLGLSPTGRLVDDEREWSSSP